MGRAGPAGERGRRGGGPWRLAATARLLEASVDPIPRTCRRLGVARVVSLRVLDRLGTRHLYKGGRGFSSDSISTVGRGVSTLSARHLTGGVGGLRGFYFLIRCAFILGRSVSPLVCGTCTGFGAGVPFDDGKGMRVCIPHVSPFPPPAADTCRRSSRSLLLPTSIAATWWEDSRRASRSHSPT